MQIHPCSSGGWFARHHARCSRCRHDLASRSSPSSERLVSARESCAGGRPRITVSQRRVLARKLRIWRRQRAAARVSARRSAGAIVVVAVVVLGSEVVLVLGIPSVLLEPAAAAAAVARPANASSNPQARMERRNAYLPGRLQVGGRAGGKRRRCAPLGAAYAIVATRVATVATCVRR